MKEKRIETDALGQVEVDCDRLWGAQTERSLIYFSIGSDLMPKEMVRAMAFLKKNAALANCMLKHLSEQKTHWIVQAADEVIQGKHDHHFPLNVWMTGSGTQFNMNMNEVLSNRSIQMAGGVLGSKDPVHPNDHVNMSQSSNDVFPTAMHIATALILKEMLIPKLEKMERGLGEKVVEWKDIVKIGRTHLQDAVPLTLGQEFSAYQQMIRDNLRRLHFVLDDVYQLTLGGTAVGTGLNAPEGFAKLTVEKISEETGLPFILAPNRFAFQGAHDVLVMVSGVFRTLACSLYKIANDIRLLGCGPRAGFNELYLPANEPGSSIMPGKINPTQCEAMTMVAAQVMGNDVAVGLGGAGGDLEMNVYKPMIIFNLIQSAKTIADSCNSFTDFLLKDVKPNRKKINRYVHESLMLVTALSPVIGYDQAAKMAHYAFEHDLSLKEANKKLQLIDEKAFDHIVNPSKMV